jgi:outer membrane receptor protein involved in Fe transport
MFLTKKFGKRPLTLAVAAAVVPVLATTAQAQTSRGASAILEEVVVTATKRAENLQDVPISVQALTGDSMRAQGAMTFDDYVNFLPNVVDAGNGPGSKEVYMRGSATEQSSVTVALAQGSAPGVALYLDETPVSLGARNLDVYATDIERIETLSGPQGTLFGASSQAGTIRMITNKPVIGETEARIDAGFASTSGGAESDNVEAMLNLPIGDNMALRFVGYSNTQGGWIDNKRATFTPNGEVIDRNSIGFGPQLVDYPNSDIQSTNNNAIARSDQNEAKYSGFRAGFKWDINEDWSALVQHSSQDLDVDGSFLVDPSVGAEAQEKYVAEYNRDEFELTTLTVEGRIAGLDVVYATSSLDREIDALIDYTHYNNGGGYITYYLCSGDYSDGSGLDRTTQNTCFDPTKMYQDTSSNERTTHELRISSDPDNRLRFLAGVYASDVETKTLGEFQYRSTGAAFSEFNLRNYDSAPYQTANETIPGVAGTNQVGPAGPTTTFYNDFTRGEEEVAFFGQVAFDISDDLTATFSARRYELETQLQGASNFSFGCRYEGNGGGGAADGFCNSHLFSNSVTDRFLTLGALNAGNISQAEFEATRSWAGGSLDMFRGGGDNTKTFAAIQAGNLDISKINPDGSTTEEATIIRLSLDWQMNDDVMIYGVYSEGYRPATQNRNAGQLATNQCDPDEPNFATCQANNPYDGYVVPAVAVTDTLENLELGMKSELMDGRLRLNAVAYRTEIENLQVSRFDPSNVAFLVFMENIGDAETSGIDLDFIYMASDNLTLSGAVSTLDTELTRINSQLNDIAVPVGSELPFAPSFSGNIRARYDFQWNGGDAWLNAALVYRGATVSGIVGSGAFMEDTQSLAYGRSSGFGLQNEGGVFGTVEDSNGDIPLNSRYKNDAATTINVGMGYGRDNWTAEVYINNLTGEEGYVVQTAGKFTPEASMMRPRTMGLRLSYSF